MPIATPGSNNPTSSDKVRSGPDGLWLFVIVAVVLWLVLVGAGMRVIYLMVFVDLPGYREPVLIAHGVDDANDIEIGHMVMTSRIFLFMAPWPDPLPAVSNPPLTATDTLPVPVDNSEAAGYRAKAAVGNVASASKLGQLYYDGKGVPINFNEAYKWFQVGADHGDAYSEDKMGEIYRDGYIVTADNSTALAWFQKAADQGLADAQDNLAWMYFYGEGVTKDEAQARMWIEKALPGLRKAADEGDPEALGDLGDLYVYGLDLPTDDTQGLSWYQKAADQGDANGQYSVGTMYEGGLGVARDIPTAVSWYKKAAAQGLPNAQIALKQLGY